MEETVLFSFPGIAVSTPHSPGSPGFLVLTSSRQPTDFDPSRFDVYLRLQHTPEDTALTSSIDCLIEAWRELRKTSPREFVLGTEFGDLLITFPDLHYTIPQNDARIDLPAEMKEQMQWEDIVREFETEVDRFVSYSKNTYSLINSPFGDTKDGSYGGEKRSAKATEAGAVASAGTIKSYDPGNYYDTKNPASAGRVVLVDEENGSEVGEVGGYQVNSIGVVPGNKDPVEITFPQGEEDGAVIVRPADYLVDALDPVYKNSSIVQTATTVSRLVVTTSVYLSNAMESGAKTINDKTQPNVKPLVFQPSTHQRFQQVHTLTSTAAKFSSATLGKVQALAQNAGAKLAGRDNEKGKPRNPGILNKSLIAFCTIADGIDYASKSLLTSSSQAATSVVNHKYGPEAGGVAKSITGSFKNVGLVYIDAQGVSRRAVVKGVAKGMVIGRVKGGGEVIVPPNQEVVVVDGIPRGWGDGPLGGPNPGPPNKTLDAPPDYGTVQNTRGENIPGNNTYCPTPPQQAPSQYQHQPPSMDSGKGQYRF